MTPSVEVINWEIFLWALFHLGGSCQFVDVEDVALECFRLAPTRFSWRTRGDLPDFKKCSKALQDAEARTPHLLVKSPDKYARQLTAEGQMWIESNQDRLSKILDRGVPVPEPSGRPSSRLLAEIENSPPFVLWQAYGTLPREKWRMAEVLRCTPDSSPDTWACRLASARGIAYHMGKDNLLRFLDAVAAAYPDWFGG